VPPHPPRSFTPPTADQVRAHLARYPSRGSSRTAALIPTLALAAIIFLALGAQNAVMFLLPWLLLGALLVFMALRVRRARELDAAVARAQEWTMWRRREDALRQAWRLLPRLATNPELHGRAVAAIAHNLDALGAHEAAIVAYDQLIDHLPEGHPISVQLRVQRTMAELGADRLTDADASLRRLRGAVEPFRKTPIGASYRLASLIQQSRTHHDADAVAESGELLDELRPLGVEAGFGHALMALAFVRLGEGEAAPPDWRDQASLWWSRATLLVAVDRLVERFGEARLAAERLGGAAASDQAIRDKGQGPLGAREIA
jgi:hypothetical protein